MRPTVQIFMKRLKLILCLQAADFQMAFPLEAIVTQAPELASPKMKEYVKRVQERCVKSILFLQASLLTDSFMTLSLT